VRRSSCRARIVILGHAKPKSMGRVRGITSGTVVVFRSTIAYPVRIIRRVFVVHGVFVCVGLQLDASGVEDAP
jgi:hypothetical protein